MKVEVKISHFEGKSPVRMKLKNRCLRKDKSRGIIKGNLVQSTPNTATLRTGEKTAVLE